MLPQGQGVSKKPPSAVSAGFSVISKQEGVWVIWDQLGISDESAGKTANAD